MPYVQRVLELDLVASRQYFINGNLLIGKAPRHWLIVHVLKVLPDGLRLLGLHWLLIRLDILLVLPVIEPGGL